LDVVMTEHVDPTVASPVAVQGTVNEIDVSPVAFSVPVGGGVPLSLSVIRTGSLTSSWPV